MERVQTRRYHPRPSVASTGRKRKEREEEWGRGVDLPHLSRGGERGLGRIKMQIGGEFFEKGRKTRRDPSFSSSSSSSPALGVKLPLLAPLDWVWQRRGWGGLAEEEEEGGRRQLVLPFGEMERIEDDRDSIVQFRPLFPSVLSFV